MCRIPDRAWQVIEWFALSCVLLLNVGPSSASTDHRLATAPYTGRRSWVVRGPWRQTGRCDPLLRQILM